MHEAEAQHNKNMVSRMLSFSNSSKQLAHAFAARFRWMNLSSFSLGYSPLPSDSPSTEVDGMVFRKTTCSLQTGWTPPLPCEVFVGVQIFYCLLALRGFSTLFQQNCPSDVFVRVGPFPSPSQPSRALPSGPSGEGQVLRGGLHASPAPKGAGYAPSLSTLFGQRAVSHNLEPQTLVTSVVDVRHPVHRSCCR